MRKREGTKVKIGLLKSFNRNLSSQSEAMSELLNVFFTPYS